MRLICLLTVFWGLVSPPPQEHPAFSERSRDREHMVEQDIRRYPGIQVRDPAVLAAMKRVPRHVFVPEEYAHLAYENRPLPIGLGQTISQPVIVAHMSELLDLEPQHKVLEIGTGSGYQAAVLAELCQKVYTMEIVAPLGEKAKKTLDELGYANIHVRIGDGYEGWIEAAPFDRIIVTCAPDDIPEALTRQLAPGGRMVLPVGSQETVQSLVVITKGPDGSLGSQKQYPVRFVPMTGKRNPDL